MAETVSKQCKNMQAELQQNYTGVLNYLYKSSVEYNSTFFLSLHPCNFFYAYAFIMCDAILGYFCVKFC